VFGPERTCPAENKPDCSSEPLQLEAAASGLQGTGVRTVPFYQFGIHNSERFEDHEGINLPDDLTARRHAIGVIHELQTANEANWRGFKMEVRRDGQLLWEIPFETNRIDG
jgi:hypothetical protein